MDESSYVPETRDTDNLCPRELMFTINKGLDNTTVEEKQQPEEDEGSMGSFVVCYFKHGNQGGLP